MMKVRYSPCNVTKVFIGVLLFTRLTNAFLSGGKGQYRHGVGHLPTNHPTELASMGQNHDNNGEPSPWNPDDSAIWNPEEAMTNGNVNRPNKADLYSNDELEQILNLHNSLTNNEAFSSAPVTAPEPLGEDFPNSPLGGIHDMVLQAIGEMPSEEPPKVESNKYKLSEDLAERIPKIRAIASDVDGTLIDRERNLHPTTEEAILKAVTASLSPKRPLEYFFPATGKSRFGAMNSLGPEMAEILSTMPGVFIQGLYCVNSTGQVVFEQKLDMPNVQDLIAAAEDMAVANGLTVLAYDGDTICSTTKSLEMNPHHIQEVNTVWGESPPVILETAKNYENGFHKLIFMADTPEEIQAFRPKMEELAKPYGATITSAIPVMLELLPANSGKEVGVLNLCKYLGIDMATEVLAMGDGENDLEFLKQASIGVAMGNALDIVKNSEGTDIVMKETNAEGGAGLAIELFGFGEALEN